MRSSCRVCLSKMDADGSFFYVLDQSICEKFKDLTQIELVLNDNYPKLICSECCNELDKAHQYRCTLIEKEKRLKSLVQFKNQKLEEPKSEVILIQDIKEKQQEEPSKSSESEQDITVTEEEIHQVDEVQILEGHSLQQNPDTFMIEEFIEDVEESETEQMQEEIEIEQQSDENLKYISECSEASVKFDETKHNSELFEVDEEVDDSENQQEIFYKMENEEEETFFILDPQGEEETEVVVRERKPYIKRRHDVENCIFKCWFPNCESKFPLKVSLKRHMNKIHGMKVSKSSCMHCGEKFETYVEFLAHSKVHRKFQCSFCQSSFSKSEALDTHLEKYHSENDTDNRPFECNQCQAKFKRKEHLKSHISYKHNSERKFQCTSCPMSFLTRQDLKSHYRTHTGEKPFKCYRCPEDFRDLKSLKRHNLVDHLTNKIYVCDICKDDFDLFRNFNFHRKEHLKSEYKEMITEQIQAEVYDMTSRYEMDGENSVNVECDSGSDDE